MGPAVYASFRMGTCSRRSAPGERRWSPTASRPSPSPGSCSKAAVELEADIIVTATGLNLQLLGGMQLSVDGRPIKPSETVVYRGMMLSGIPNFAMAIGYTNSSWTLKIGLLCEYFCRLLRHMDDNGYDIAWAVADPAMPTRPLLDFGAGYVQRSLADLPRQGPAAPWLMSMNYEHDRKLLRSGDVADENLHFFVIPRRSRDGRSVRGAVTGRRSKHSTRTTG